MWLQFKLRGEEVKDRYKFRVWNNFQKKMFAVYAIDYRNMLICAESEKNTTHTFGFIDCTLMQCTGLKDKNGNLIFEGDIMRLPDGVTQVVKWSDDYLHFALYDKDKQRGHILIEKDDEIIGNIHDGN